MLRVDANPTHEYGKFELRPGKPLPFGATIVPGGGVNFSVYSRHATSCELVLFRKYEPEPFATIPFPDEFRIGNVFTMVVFALTFEDIEYGYRMDGPFNPGEGHWFDRTRILLDPYAKAIGGRDVWGEEPDRHGKYPYRARIFFDDSDWEDDHSLEIPLEYLIIYEIHVRGFTQHPSSGVRHPGTFAGIREKIPYLKELGINCVEFMPIHEFDEFENGGISSATGQPLMNYWGYSNVGLFAPKAGYAASGKYGMQVDEFKALVKELHKNGIEVILDVVFNHTAEGNEDSLYISYRGIDNKTYYMLTSEGHCPDFSGRYNTLNYNNPIVRNMILDSLRHWVADYHIDGFRFDLAAILGRDQNGAPMNNPALLEALAYDPILGKCKLITEAWDAGGLRQVDSLPSSWAEWNGKFRDDLRKFLKGEPGTAEAMRQRIAGSPDLDHWRGANASINFVTSHDGFTLMDLVSYNEKHNEANGEENADETDHNNSWNCGWEGPTDDIQINNLRIKQIKNAVAMQMVSHGTPMILSGDEMGRTQQGNDHAYCQDNEISWLDWSLLDSNAELLNFYKKMITFRMAHPVLKSRTHLQNKDYANSGYPDISWHVDSSDERPIIAFLLCGMHARGGTEIDDYIYVVMNMHQEAYESEIPKLPEDMSWYVFANTDMQPPEDIFGVGYEAMIENQLEFTASPRSVVILVGR